MIPTFGLDIIRKFTNDVSGLKQLAARDFEDILQVRIEDAAGSQSLTFESGSVSFPFLKGSSQKSTGSTRRISSTHSSFSQLGTHTPSFAFTRNIPSRHLKN